MLTDIVMTLRFGIIHNVGCRDRTSWWCDPWRNRVSDLEGALYVWVPYEGRAIEAVVRHSDFLGNRDEIPVPPDPAGASKGIS